MKNEGSLEDKEGDRREGKRRKLYCEGSDRIREREGGGEGEESKRKSCIKKRENNMREGGERKRAVLSKGVSVVELG